MADINRDLMICAPSTPSKTQELVICCERADATFAVRFKRSQALFHIDEPRETRKMLTPNMTPNGSSNQ